MRNKSLAGLAAAAAVASALIGAAPALAAAHTPVIHAPKRSTGASTSSNWSGYDVTGSGATAVSGVWTQPAVTCSPSESSWSSPWVGLDGDTSNTVEQTGTDSDCVKGTPTYYAWYEMYPKKVIEIPTIAVHPGDVFLGSVTYTSGTFVLKLTDTTTGASYTTTQSSKKAALASAEWILEGPSNGLLSDFGSVSFSDATATINGQSAGLSKLSGAEAITMAVGGTVRAQPSAVKNDAFSVTWEHS